MNAAAAIHAPLLMGIQAASKSWRPGELALGCEAEDEARRAGISLTKFIDRCVSAFLHLAPLDAENREFVFEIARNLGRPWTAWDVLNRVVSTVRERKLRLFFVQGQRRIQRSLPLFGEE